ncbi:MAG: hypothetical protein LBU61_03335 [Coriobacteriales bacterium]|jgi:uroporphyrinogen decarboxylase|nr:hypothetical protein [Coriobacteriales bacterium]
MTIEEIKQEKIDRYLKAVAYEEVDRTPVATSGSVAVCRYADPAIQPGDIIHKPEYAIDAYIEGLVALDVDMAAAFEYPLMMDFMAKNTGLGYTEFPGIELPYESYWQIREIDCMEPEHYDYIIENGLQAYQQNIVSPIVGPMKMEYMEKMPQVMGMYMQKIADKPIPAPLSSEMGLAAHLHFLNWGRGFGNFLLDVRRIPEKVLAAIKVIDDFQFETAIIPALEKKPAIFTVFMVRDDQDAMRLDKWEEYFWPYYLKVQEAIEKYSPDTIFQIHIDGNYTKHAIQLIARDLRPGKTIIQFDGMEDSEAMAEALTASKICFYGDIHPAMLTLGTPDEVYDYAMKLKQLYGNGLILSSGCSLPPDTKPENLKAMVDAARDSAS